MRKIVLIVVGLILSSCDSVSFAPRRDPGMEGYWKGYYQYQDRTVGGETSETPRTIYLKLEQTDQTVIGVYSTEFDASRFKAAIPKEANQVWGTVNKASVKLTLQMSIIPLLIFEGSLHNGALSGTFSQTLSLGTSGDSVLFGRFSIQKY